MTQYAAVAINTPVRQTFDYHIPDALHGKIEPGHLVRVAFGTAMQPGIVVRLSDESQVEKTKPIEARLDPHPVLSEWQIELSEWMSETYFAPIGVCLWLWLPPGLTGHSDALLTLIQPEAAPDDPLQAQIVTLLKRKGTMRFRQVKQSIGHEHTDKAAKALIAQGVLSWESILTLPSARPQKVQTAALAIHPRTIPDIGRYLGKRSRRADLLETIADFTRITPQVDVNTVVTAAASTKATLKKLADEEGLVEIEGDCVRLALPLDEVEDTLLNLRKADTDLRVLRMLARENQPVDVSWVYAQTGAKMMDLKRLADLEFVVLGEKYTWRDSLADRDFVPVKPPKLTQGQQKVWDEIYPSLTLPVDGEGTNDTLRYLSLLSEGTSSLKAEESSGFKRWQTTPHLWELLKPLAQEKRDKPTPAENHLWQHLRRRQLGAFKFRRQHVIERFIVDFYSHEARLIVEVDGEYHQYTQEEDKIRQTFLEDLGFRVLRFTNQEVFEAVEYVLEKILEELQNPTLDANSSLQFKHIPPSSTGEVRRGSSCFLLHGVTGSGKTEVYLRAIEAALEQGRQAIFLVPEIALTAQTVRRVTSRFPGRVALIHSRLGIGELYDTWRRCREGLVDVVVGTRSALFAPLPDVGCICIDEEHDDSYKNFATPHYDTRQVAEAMMKRQLGVLIMGSATPDIATFHRAQDPNDSLIYLQLPDRIMGHRVRISEQSEREGLSSKYHRDDADEALTIALPAVQIVDMRDELKAGNTSMFSRSLHEALEKTLLNREQAILLLNRRGMATYVFCRDCGYSVLCPRCDTPLTHHQYSATLKCHHCGYEARSPQTCPNCTSKRIKFFGAGTQQVEAEIEKLFPRARIVRWDSDTATNAEMHDAILGRFLDQQADIMVGTQLVAKGLDLPRVTLVGVVSADTGLNLPDFRSCERTFQLLTQVAGRAGRGLLGGQVILQTYQPDNYAIRAAAKHDYAGFYQQELEYRRQMGYPPFRRLARIVFQNSREFKARDQAQRAAEFLREEIQEMGLTGTELIGPAPCFFSRLNDHYRWHLLIRSPDPTPLIDRIDPARGWYVDLDPVDVL
jgi:primosomal protein N'